MGKRLLIISTGGTIAQKIDDKTLATITTEDGRKGDFEKILPQEDLGKMGIDSITAQEVTNKDSSNINPEDWKKMADAVRDKYDDYDAFIITHGTNTLGYTCSALSFALENVGKPVILTGSQVTFGLPGSDAGLNLQNAIRVAASPIPLVGVMAVFGSQIITGTRVLKVTEFDYDGFKSYNTALPLGRIGREIKFNKEELDAHSRLYSPAARNARELKVSAAFDMRIISLTEFPGMTSELMISLVDSGEVRGIIFNAVGSGDPNMTKKKEDGGEPHEKYDLREGFENAQTRKVPIVVSSQAADGIASMALNDPGVEAVSLGAIPGWDMSLEAMTVKLGWLLGNKVKYDDIQRQMTMSIKGEMNRER